MSLKDCITEAAKKLKKTDAKAMQQLVDGGMSETEAVEADLATINSELLSIAEMAEKRGAVVARVGDLAPAPEEKVAQTPAEGYLQRALDAQTDLEERVAAGFRGGKPIDKKVLKRERLKVLEVDIITVEESVYNLTLTFPAQPILPNSKWIILGTVLKDQYPQLHIAR